MHKVITLCDRQGWGLAIGSATVGKQRQPAVVRHRFAHSLLELSQRLSEESVWKSARRWLGIVPALLLGFGVCLAATPRQAPLLATFLLTNSVTTGVAFSPNGESLAAGSTTGELRVWSVADGRELLAWSVGSMSSVWSIAYSPDGRRFLTCGELRLMLWDSQTGKLVQTYPPSSSSDWLERGPFGRRYEMFGDRVEVVAFSPDGRRLLAGGNEGMVGVWDAASGETQLLLGRQNGPQIHAAAFSPDGLSLVIGDYEGTLTFYSVAGGRELRTIRGHTNAIEYLAYFPDGKRVVTASYDQTARIWDVARGTEILAFRGHQGRLVMSVAVSPDGQRVATGGSDGVAKVWEADSGQELLLLQGHKQIVECIAYSPDGRRVATTSWDGTVKLWDVTLTSGTPVSAGGEDLRLESGYSPLPMLIRGDPLGREVRSLRLVGKVPSQGDGTGEVWLDTRSAELNEFGDVLRRVGTEPQPVKVKLRYVATGLGETKNGMDFLLESRTSKGLRLYDLVFSGGTLGGGLQLVLGTATYGPHRLLVHGVTPPSSEGFARGRVWAVPLDGLPRITSTLPDAALPQEFDLSGYYTDLGGRVHRIELRGGIGAKGALSLDPNQITLDMFGEFAMITGMYSPPHEVTLRSAEGPDPLGQGRKLCWVVSQDSRNTNRVAVILGRSEAGPHRILLYRGDQVAYVLPVHLSVRRRAEEKLAEESALSAGERQALADLRKLIGSDFQLRVEGSRALALTFTQNAQFDLVQGILPRLPNLETVEFVECRLPAAGFADLARLPKLLAVSFRRLETSPSDFAHLADLNQIQALDFHSCQGITDESLTHLSGLVGLKRLGFHHEELLSGLPRRGACITDAGVACLSKLSQLEALDLVGHEVSDRSLPTLLGLVRLRELSLSGLGLTEDGFRKLAELPNLWSLYLIKTGLSTNVAEEIRTRLPKLQLEVWGRDGQ
jgi:hypothetical protein